MKIAMKLIKLREEYNLTQTELAKIAGVSSKSISAWELEKRDPKIQPIKSICKYFGIDINDFIDESSDIYKSELPKNMVPYQTMKKIPLVGTIACGQPILAEENITDYIDLPGHIKADYALSYKGDSMINAGINDGDIVYIRKQETVENGQIAAVLVEDGNTEATLKRFYFSGNTVMLNAENPEYAPLVYVGAEIENVHVIGLAVAFTHIIK